MIPKIIHYCWFGRGELSPLTKMCIESWKKFLPDYEIMLWNEDNFDVTANKFTRQAYEKRKYAFVSDYVRLWALKNHGGVYMDTDIEVIRPLDDFMAYPAFGGFETDKWVSTGILASRASEPWIDYILTYYAKRGFIRWNGKLNKTPNPQIFSKMFAKKGLKLNNTYQVYDNSLHIFPKDYFCPKSYDDGKITITENTRVIHHFSGTWK